jgi:hypothetical protein
MSEGTADRGTHSHYLSHFRTSDVCSEVLSLHFFLATRLEVAGPSADI